MTETEKNCPCKRVKCERYGQCEKCREHHAAKNIHLRVNGLKKAKNYHAKNEGSIILC